jgi:predicted dehydrogenase/threonine dehydrogenase-like Zn-dependent dehydrogenase
LYDADLRSGRRQMKQLAQRMKDGQLRVLDVPLPELGDGKVLVRTGASLVSAGTERAKVEIGKESLLGKARRRPDQVRQVVDKVRTEGLTTTVVAVRNRLEAFTPLGYCAAGYVERVGAQVRDVRAGDVVACGGEEAAHAEILAVPANLCVPVPDGVEVVEAAFTTLGSIALHGFRQADLRLGERVAIVGMGLVGQLAARIARAAGCEVFGIDLESWRLELAEQADAVHLSRLRGEVTDAEMSTCDAVLVTAAAPTTNDPVSLATDLARERGKIVIVGDVLLELDRRRLYAKELEVRLARSYGPGRYDREYEQRGLDYPIGYVRWTERRNMTEFLRLLAERRIEVGDLITHRFPIDQADRALDAVSDSNRRALGVVIDYAVTPGLARAEAPSPPQQRHRTFSPGSEVGFIGAGSFARRLLIPLARRHGLLLDRVATASGLSAASVAEQFEFSRGACTVHELLGDDSTTGVVVATRHDLHGSMTLAALQAGKAVFVEKPLCLTEVELGVLRKELDRDNSPPLMVGFNRRFAPLTRALRNHLDPAQGPTNVIVRVNAGSLYAEHWLNDPTTGGGRLLGEGCHFLDLIVYLTGSDPVAVNAQARQRANEPVQSAQDFSVSIRFADESLGILLYGTAGAAAAGKELVEAHREGRSGRIDDFRSLRLWGAGRRRSQRAKGQEKGHDEEMRVFAEVVRGESLPPPVGGYLTSTEVALAALRSLEGRAEVLVQSSRRQA